MGGFGYTNFMTGQPTLISEEGTLGGGWLISHKNWSDTMIVQTFAYDSNAIFVSVLEFFSCSLACEKSTCNP